MNKEIVSIVRYERPMESVRRAVDLSRGLEHVPPRAKVFIKPNIVFWTRSVPFPKWGVITTSRVVEDMVIVLKDLGIDDIVIGEGMLIVPKDRETPSHAFESLGYNYLKRRYGVKPLNIYERPFERVDLGEGVVLNFNSDFIQSDFVVNIPVLKTHPQTVVSLGIKNLKGMLDIKSRKKCHSTDPEKDLHYMIARLVNQLPPSFTIIDGIYSNERGPNFDGNIRRSNILVASSDILSADMVGTNIMGHNSSDVPHLVHAAEDRGRPLDLSDIKVVGERIEEVIVPHEYSFPYNEDGTLPLLMVKMGIKGLSYPKYDSTVCTYCSGLSAIILRAIGWAWTGEPWDDVEVLTGKVMKASPGKKTILIGKCIYQANKDNSDIREMIAIKGCPPSPKAIAKAFHQAGIDVNREFIENLDRTPGYFMKKYEGRPEFDESFFRIA